MTNNRPTTPVGEFRDRKAALEACLLYATPAGMRWEPVPNDSKFSIRLVRDRGRDVRTERPIVRAA